MTSESPKVSQSTTDSFPVSSPSFWQAAAEVQDDAGLKRSPERTVHFVSDEKATEEQANLPALGFDNFYASDTEEDAAAQRRERAAREYMMNPEYAPNKFGDIGDYMRKKDIKVQTQYRDLANEADVSVAQIFQGYVFHINGNTDPPLEVLRKLILYRGGVIMPVLRKKTAVTHIIAPVLPPSKHVAFAEYKVVKPAWIVESANANQVLDWRRWKLVPTGGDLEQAQKGMGKFLAGASQPAKAKAQSPKSPSRKGEETIPFTTLPVPPRPPDPVLRGHDSIQGFEESVDGTADEGQVNTSDAKAPSMPAILPADEHAATIASTLQGSAAIAPESSKASAAPLSVAVPSPVKIGGQPPARAPQPYKNPWKNYFKFEENPDAQRLMKDAEWQQKHTAQAGNDFIDGYYQQSRLHHLSTWKAELKVLVSAAQKEAESAPRPCLHDPSVDTLSLATSVLPRVDSPARANLKKAEGKVIFHVDFDAFFVSCGLALRPALKGKPTVVCHSQGRAGAQGSTSEIASCSYEARAKGVKNGMSLGRARELCPGILTIPYEFDTYKKFSLAFYTILMGYADDLEAVSVDEALIDATCAVRAMRLSPDESAEETVILRGHSRLENDEGDSDNVFMASQDNMESLTSFKPRDWAVEVAQKIRDDVRAATGCEVSIGISHNILLAKLATRHAKPAGVYHLLPAATPSFIAPLDVEDFPSIGRSTRDKITERFGTVNCGELLKQSKQSLKDLLGPKSGDTLYGFLRGEDERKLEAHKERKSVSAEVNYGIRFNNQEQADQFLENLAQEVSSRLKKLDTRGKMLTLKIMSRHPDAPVEAPKFMGHGVCETFNKSAAISRGSAATDDATVIAQESIKILHSLSLDSAELRGIGMQITKLESGSIAAGLPDRPRDQPALNFQPVNAAAQAPTKPVLVLDNAVGALVDAALAVVSAQGPSALIPMAPMAPKTPFEDPDFEVDIDSSFLEAMPSSIRRELEEEVTAIRNARSTSRAMSEVPAHPVLDAPRLQARAATKSPAKHKASERNPAAHITKQLRPIGVKSFLATKDLAEQPLFKRKRQVTPIHEEVIDLTYTPSKRPKLDRLKLGLYNVDRLKDLGIDLEWFAALPPNMQDEQVREKESDVKRTPSRVAALPDVWRLEPPGKQRRSISASVSPSRDRPRFAIATPAAPVIAVRRSTKPMLSKKQDLDDILDVISSWVDAGKAVGPAEKDAARVMKYLGKCLDLRVAGQGGLGDACTVLSWWKSLLSGLWPNKDGDAGRKWWAVWEMAAQDCNIVSLKRYRAPLRL